MPVSKATASSLLALAFVGSGVAAGWYANQANEAMRAHPARFCYEAFRGPANATRYITAVGDSSAYLRYYRAVRRGQNPAIAFPLHGLAPGSPVYVQRWLGADSALAEVVNYDENAGKSRPGMVRCYVDAHTLHMVPPHKKAQGEQLR